MLEDQNALEGINHVLNQPKEGNTAQNLRVMSNMVAQLKSVGYVFQDEQQLQSVIRSFSNKWEHFKVK